MIKQVGIENQIHCLRLIVRCCRWGQLSRRGLPYQAKPMHSSNTNTKIGYYGSSNYESTLSKASIVHQGYQFPFAATFPLEGNYKLPYLQATQGARDTRANSICPNRRRIPIFTSLCPNIKNSLLPRVVGSIVLLFAIHKTKPYPSNSINTSLYPSTNERKNGGLNSFDCRNIQQKAGTSGSLLLRQQKGMSSFFK